jgi:prepilin-type N-terminal cleavage/methylation domain-containing protein
MSGGGICAYGILTSGISEMAVRGPRGWACASERRAPFLLGETQIGRTPPGRRRAGFTLVEVIVVLVILAILAAIAIPALTGYIDKAEDKKYIADARNHIVAMRTVLIEAYNKGDFSEGTANDYFLNGTSGPAVTNAWAWSAAGKKKSFTVDFVSESIYGSQEYRQLDKLASALIAEANTIGDPSSPPHTTPHWGITVIGPDDPGTTLLNADGFAYWYFPEGSEAGKPMVMVTYKLEHIDEIGDDSSLNTTVVQTKFKNAAYDANAGYYVYHMRR